MWFAVASPALFALLRRTLHAGAAGLAVGAVAGMYVRGLFFDYSMIWRSTFVHDPAWVLGSLRLLLGPACALLGRLAPTLDDANALMSLEGQSAAPWIHLYAVTALLVVIGPRLALALMEHLRTRWALAHLTLPVTDPYCRARLDEARELQVRQIVDAIDADVRAACTDLTAAVVRVVCDDLYDRRIVPHLERFREDGGALADLETAIATECEAFRSTLDSQLSDVQHGFELAVGRSLERTIGRQLGLVGGLPTDLVTTISASSAGSTRAVGASVGTSIADVVGLTVSGAVAVVAGVVSGGLGKSLGTAILVSLLGTSGPVGLLVGGLAGLVVAGAGWWFGREVLADSIRDIPLSGAVVRTALWSSRYEQLVVRGRDACAAAVEDLMQRELEPLVPTLTDQLWVVVRRVLGERRAAARDRP